MASERMCCQDCGHDTRLMNERYMLREDTWDEATYENFAYMLCIGCLELRLGRTLDSGDFVCCPLNYEDLGRHSLRLRSRLVRWPAGVPV